MLFKFLDDHRYFETKSIELDEDMIKLMDKFQYHSKYRDLKGDLSYQHNYACAFLINVIEDILANPHKFSYKDFDCINKMVSRINNDRELTINYINGTYSHFKNSNM